MKFIKKYVAASYHGGEGHFRSLSEVCKNSMEIYYMKYVAGLYNCREGRLCSMHIVLLEVYGIVVL